HTYSTAGTYPITLTVTDEDGNTDTTQLTVTAERTEVMPDGYVPVTGPALVVNSLEDLRWPPAGTTTLRSALEGLTPGGTITFAPSLNGETIDLWQVGEKNSLLKGEVFSFAMGRFTFEGFLERDYGPSALYTNKNVTIDASALPDGITIHWTGGDFKPARVLGVYGDLELRNLTLTGGYARSEPIDGNPAQPHTLARGGGLAVWGDAFIYDSTFAANKAEGDNDPSRDRGSFGGGIYAKALEMHDSVVSGNSVKGFGAAGGGVYSVGNPDTAAGSSSLERCALTGNRVTGQHAYGGGIYTDGGGPERLNGLYLINCTIAQNAVEDHPDIAESPMFQYYYRGGGVYMSNGYLWIQSCTIVENEVTGNEYDFSGKPNTGGGGVAATIGNAHSVESIELFHSIVVGNTVNGNKKDLFSGSLIDFYSYGYNLIGEIDFSHMLVPITKWLSMCRVHYPKVGDIQNILLGDVLDRSAIVRHNSILSVGADAGGYSVLWYPPRGAAVDRIPPLSYGVEHVWADFDVATDDTDTLLPYILDGLRDNYGYLLGYDFGTEYVTDGVIWYYTDYDGTWPSNPLNEPWIGFWRAVEDDIGGRMGPAPFNDDFFLTLEAGPLGLEPDFWSNTSLNNVTPATRDQLDSIRPVDTYGDIGAIELQ
ncbi:MAG: hypothetical protein P1P84_20735, partial [Deferrisomatales bacterium]|nr:hypothetical protein [Deferrisomatales bacterium]